MMKKLILGSVVTAALVFSGCGDDKKKTTPAADKIKPVVNATATAAIDTVIVLATDNKGVTSIELSGDDANHFTINGTTIKTPATAGTYTVKVVAKDAAGNTTTKDVVVTVTGANNGGNNGGNNGATVANEVDLGAKGKWIKIQVADVDDDLNTTDVNETSFARLSHADAAAFCTNLGDGWVLPTRDDILSIATSDVTDPANITGQIILDTRVLEDSTETAGTSVIWTSNTETSGVYLGNASTDGNPDFNVGDATTYYHTCKK